MSDQLELHGPSVDHEGRVEVGDRWRSDAACCDYLIVAVRDDASYWDLTGMMRFDGQHAWTPGWHMPRRRLLRRFHLVERDAGEAS